jgi:hypothetical protein
MFKLLVTAGLLAATIGLSRLNWFQINSIDCRLNHYPCPLQLEPTLLSFLNQNLLTLNTQTIVRQLANFDSSLTEIEVRRRLPNKLMINLLRRQPVALIKIQPNGDEFYLDKTGFVYLPSWPRQSSLPPVLWPRELPLAEGDSALSRNLAQLINTLAAYYVSFSQVIRLPEGIYLVKTGLGPEAVISATTDFPAAVGSLQFILTNLKIEKPLPAKIDLRFDQPILTY